MSLAGPGHEKEITFRVIICGTDGWTWTGGPAHSKLVNELNFGGVKGAAAPNSRATGVNGVQSEDNLTSEGREIQVTDLSFDDPHVHVKNARHISTPRVFDVARPHRAVRYNAGTLGVYWLFRWQRGGETLKL